MGRKESNQTNKLEIRVCNKNIFPYFSTKTYVMGTQKYSLISSFVIRLWYSIKFRIIMSRLKFSS